MSPLVPRIRLRGGYEISRIIKGGWQLAGEHGPVDSAAAPDEMAEFVRGGITTFDCADIYTGVEAMIGQFRARHPDLARQVRVHTKFVPDLTALGSVDSTYVTRSIDRSLQRLGMEQLDVVQFHWWDFSRPGCVEAALELDRLRRQGKIGNVSVTNFDVPHLAELVTAGVPVFSNQVQYSLLDARPERSMVDYCLANDIVLFCYGTVAGGFLSERWLNVTEPQALVNRSLIKYRLIIKDFGGWDLFQQLLQALRGAGQRHGCDIATVASAWMLRKPAVAAVIVGATNTSHLAANQRIGALQLQPADIAAIDQVLQRRTGPLGDVYELERDINGRHGRIMKYELNG